MALANQNIDYSVATQPHKDGAPDCGDFAIVKTSEKRVFLAAIDVAGHGKGTRSIKMKIIHFLESNYHLTPIDVVQGLHDYIRGSRGCAGAFCELNLEENYVKHLGIGNVQVVLFSQTKQKRLVNRNGVIGYVLPPLREDVHEFNQNDMLLGYSDGIQEYFKLKSYIDLQGKPSTDYTDAIMKKYAKASDDAMCLFLKRN